METSGFTEDQRSELEELIARAVAGAKPPDPPPSPKVKPITDAEWDAFSDRQRESWVRGLVVDVIDGLRREDDDRRRDEDIANLKDAANRKPELEATPDPVSPFDRIRKWLWGEEK